MNLPTKLTFLRIFMIPAFMACFFIPLPFFRFAACAVFVLAAFTDTLDGQIARKYNMVTDLGKFLDPIADKMLVACALIAVSLDAHAFQTGTAVCAMLILCRELMISGFRIVASSKGVKLAADGLGKIKTVLQMTALILLIPFADIAALSKTAGDAVLYCGLIILAAAAVMTLVSGANYLIKNKGVLSEKADERIDSDN
ncbi:MAG: CDP-diacylglycerol--glycerol-3-phosphate 3-phosphatidyltransferase [Clostridiales bacterium]|jgi:CDP-diacylglycerol--glycerol-3-phosphate 3-phosphatidyltransferase|nr:CDP-diacylglycerol--glycerol-3-phosphate 3-phosphatidyltransferase [Clostridiales bacterium]